MAQKTKTKQIEKNQFRQMEIDRSAVDEKGRTVELSFSSDEPYERWWGVEILDHEPGSMRVKRLKASGALLMDHNSRDQVGVLEKVWIGDDRKGRAIARFGKSARAEEIWQDVIDGIRKSVSVGYIVHRAVLVEEKEGVETYRIMDWEPFEVSLVSVPADVTVGVGREASDQQRNHSLVIKYDQKEIPMEKETVQPDPAAEAAKIKDITEKARQAEQTRIREITAYGEKFNLRDFAGEAINRGASVDEFRMQVLEKIGKVKPVETTPDIGLSDRQARQFSFVRLLHALSTGRREHAAFEFECSDAVAKQLGKSARGGFVPMDVLRRDLNVTTDAQGGHLVDTNLLAADFITLLRNKMVIAQLGTRMLTGLVGDVAIPGALAGSTAYWVGESTDITTESTQTFRQVALTPKTVGAYSDISRKLLLQSSLDVEMYVRNELATTVALEIDRAAINGSGSSPEPRGILNVVGIGAVVGGTNGKAPTYANIVGLESEVAIDNADVGALAFLTNAKVRGKLRTVFTNATYGEIPVWTDGADGMGRVIGYRAAVSNQVPSTLTKGSSNVCSAIIFGNFADLVIGQWGALDIMVDPITGGLQGTVRVIALQDVDIAVKNAVSFSAMKDALTT
ncbi:MAG: phage major capsid protein [Desulfobacterales bacterium]|jgi:HK97 family phage major capsid protein|nr:phage major capsid protein [Desulfobacterales bacterium]MCU0601296.1 phage major capsid protein [Desulfobacterales bacterium]